MTPWQKNARWLFETLFFGFTPTWGDDQMGWNHELEWHALPLFGSRELAQVYYK